MKHTVKEERPFVCQETECGQRFVLPAYLRLHTEKVHNKSDSRYMAHNLWAFEPSLNEHS